MNAELTSTHGTGIDNIPAMAIHGSSGTTNYYYLKDLSNTVLALANSSGSIVESYNYDAYGNVTIKNSGGNVISTSAYGNRFLFQGREYDYTTQLYNFRARWYDPETGRWLSNDPIGISGGLNLYAFCGNDPVNYMDPMGLDIWVLEVLSSKYSHVVVVGDNGYNEILGVPAYWVSQLNPAWKLFFRIAGPGEVTVGDFYLDPRNTEEIGKGYKILEHIQTSPCVDMQTYEEAQRMVTEWDWYLCLGHNCYAYADDLLGYAKAAQIEYNFRELIFRVDYAPTPIPFYSPRMPLN